MEDVARHEIAHALDYETRGRSAHDRTWKAWARRCGADPTRCYEGELADDPTSPYVGRCPAPGCGHVRPFYRAVTSSYFCPRCEEAADRRRSYLRVTERRSGRVLHEGGPEPIPADRLEAPPKYLGRCPSLWSGHAPVRPTTEAPLRLRRLLPPPRGRSVRPPLRAEDRPVAVSGGSFRCDVTEQHARFPPPPSSRGLTAPAPTSEASQSTCCSPSLFSFIPNRRRSYLQVLYY